MQRLDLDYCSTRGRSEWAGAVLLLAAIAFAGELGFSYWTLNGRIAAVEARLPQVRTSTAKSTTVRPGPDEYAFARDTYRHLTTPWRRLFATLEHAQSERVALIAVEPDAESGTVTITGESRDYLAVLAYVANLGGKDGLSRVHLTHYEPARGAGPRPVAFTISAAWRGKR